MQKIIPNLWFDSNAEEAVDFYTSVFTGGKIHQKAYFPNVGQEIHGRQAGTVMTIEFEIERYQMMALNGGPQFTFTPAISFIVNCPSKEEVTTLWSNLSEGGKALMPLDVYPFSEQYGWIQDQYGVSWQLMYSKEATHRTIVPALMFVKENSGKARSAIEKYISIFPDSSTGNMFPYGEGHEHPTHLMYADFRLAGQTFAAMDSGNMHEFNFTEAISLVVTCENQEEIDRLWTLSAVPEAEACGWLKDEFGVSWQIVPPGMSDIFASGDTEKAERGMAAMLKMKKIDIARMKEALA
jgi:predicted 3-demethylubiquinone-9 3-methyltransferase (glyoxalase superfamily)